MPVFFCDPHHPWQRGTNENTNRLLRQLPAQERRPAQLHPGRPQRYR
jgi:IS30 family transposase